MATVWLLAMVIKQQLSVGYMRIYEGLISKYDSKTNSYLN
jgi:hypothetical protein